MQVLLGAVCVYVYICLQPPSNQHFYEQIIGYGMSGVDHRVA